MSERIGPTNNLCYMCRKPLEQPKRGQLRLTCSNKCRQARWRRKQGQRSWLDKRIQKMNRQRRALPFMERRVDQKANRAVFTLSPGRTMYECLACGKGFIAERLTTGGRVPRYCSARCAAFTRNEVKAFGKRVRIAREMGKTVDRRVWDRFAAGKLSPPCFHCGRPFAPNYTRDGRRARGRPRRYCSDACAKAMYEKRWKSEHSGYARRHRFVRCPGCGEKFDRTDSRGRRQRRFCSVRCLNRWHKREQRKRDKRSFEL